MDSKFISDKTADDFLWRENGAVLTLRLFVGCRGVRCFILSRPEADDMAGVYTERRYWPSPSRLFQKTFKKAD
jgi:hypothetical protein